MSIHPTVFTNILTTFPFNILATFLSIFLTTILNTLLNTIQNYLLNNLPYHHPQHHPHQHPQHYVQFQPQHHQPYHYIFLECWQRLTKCNVLFRDWVHNDALLLIGQIGICNSQKIYPATFPKKLVQQFLINYNSFIAKVLNLCYFPLSPWNQAIWV